MRNLKVLTSAYNWLKGAKRGETYCYYTGNLGPERARLHYDGHSFTSIPHEPLNSLAEMIWAWYEAGKVTLVQKRLGPARFQYLAVKL